MQEVFGQQNLLMKEMVDARGSGGRLESVLEEKTILGNWTENLQEDLRILWAKKWVRFTALLLILVHTHLTSHGNRIWGWANLWSPVFLIEFPLM